MASASQAKAAAFYVDPGSVRDFYHCVRVDPRDGCGGFIGATVLAFGLSETRHGACIVACRNRASATNSSNGEVLDRAASSRVNELRFVGAAESSVDCLYFAECDRNENGEIEDFVLTYLNRNAINLVTYSMEEMIGRRMGELFR